LLCEFGLLELLSLLLLKFLEGRTGESTAACAHRARSLWCRGNRGVIRFRCKHAFKCFLLDVALGVRYYLLVCDRSRTLSLRLLSCIVSSDHRLDLSRRTTIHEVILWAAKATSWCLPLNHNFFAAFYRFLIVFLLKYAIVDSFFALWQFLIIVFHSEVPKVRILSHISLFKRASQLAAQREDMYILIMSWSHDERLISHINVLNGHNLVRVGFPRRNLQYFRLFNHWVFASILNFEDRIVIRVLVVHIQCLGVHFQLAVRVSLLLAAGAGNWFRLYLDLVLLQNCADVLDSDGTCIIAK